MVDYAREINAARAQLRRKRILAWAGLSTGTVLGSLGLGALMGMGDVSTGFLLGLILCWFGWSVLVLREP